jgi:RNA polymerase sigma factor (sigma-70 family)
MQGAASRGAWKQLDALFRFGVAGHLGDAELLGRFVGRRDQDDDPEAAFAALVERHGPMVLGVCRRVLRDRHEAEDAFQATFLVLARKAASIARREQLANWLYGVACRTALDTRARAARRKARERKAQGMSPSEIHPADEADLEELRAILDEELARLPERYRGAVVLCELDGLSRHAAAQRLGIPEGTLSSRLARAKDLLRHRLTRRGLAPSAIALDAALVPEARSILIPPSLAGSTIQAATRVAVGVSLAEAASTSVATLTQGVLKAMLIAKFKGLVLGLTLATLVTTGIGVLAQAPGPPEGDRLSALERKLDRILEALGGSSRNLSVRTVTAGGGTDDPFQNPPSAPAQSIPPLDKPGPRLRPGENSSLARNPQSAPRFADKAPEAPPPPPPPAPANPEGRSHDLAPSLPQPPTMPPPPGSRSHDLDARVDALERRLADMERRFGQMERRLVRTVPPVDVPGSLPSADVPPRAPRSGVTLPSAVRE